MISRDFISQLITTCDITDIVSSYVNIKRQGRHSKALCPFHSEKTPSFVVYNDTQSFFCFGCGAGGDALSFIMLAENLDYVEALHFLAKRMGVTIPESGLDDSQMKLKSAILKINRETALFFNSCLKNPAGKDGYAYLKNRGFTDSAITTFGVGFAPDSWSSLLNHLKSKGFSEEEMLAAHVVARSSKDNLYDLFRNRIMFPIIDLRGNVVAFGGRVLDDSKPKYLNSPETLVFKKNRLLFSMNFAKSVAKDTLILAEGYLDVIAIYSAGFRNVVATLGTALTEEQARLIAKYANNVVIAYDSDQAGQKALHRAVNLFSSVGLSAKALKMENAKDPDEYIKKFGVKRFELLINGAVDVIEYELEALKQKSDMATAIGKTEYLNKAIGILADIESKLSREIYSTIVANEAGAMPQSVVEQANQLRKRKAASREKNDWRDIQLNLLAKKDKVNPEKSENLRAATTEENIIACLFQHPDFIKHTLKKLSADDFVTSFNKRIFIEMQQLYNSGADISLSLLRESFNSDEMSAISGIIARSSNISNNLDTLSSYIDVLLEYGNVITKEDVSQLNLTDLENYRQKLKNKK